MIEYILVTAAIVLAVLIATFVVMVFGVLFIHLVVATVDAILRMFGIRW